MADFLTLERARAASPFRTRSLVEAELRKSAATLTSTKFDVFLSHSVLDAEVILGVKALIETQGLSVYVDWLDDPQLDRSRVTAETAKVIRVRMRHSNSLLFATSQNSSRSKWMPWELGYFDGFRPRHVAILPLVQHEGADFAGQEYLGLYPLVENIYWDTGVRGLGISIGTRTAARLARFAQEGVTV